MHTKIRSSLAVILVVLFISLTGCASDSSDSSDSAPTAATEEEYSVNGYVQKGPFVSGSAITIQSLSNTLESTGTSYQTTITDDFGTFSMGKKIKGKYVEIIATGFYFDEVAGALSSANYTLRAVADLSSKESVNVNVLTTLEKDRIIYLMTESGKSFSEAKTQAEREILAVFNISDSSASSFDGMDICQDGDTNGILLGISAVLQGNNSVAQLSELISKINLDIKADGTLDNESYKAELKTNADNLDLAQIRSNLSSRYLSLGLTVTIPDFEKYAKNLVPGFIISSISGNTSEKGETATFSIKLNSYISSNVSISINSSDTTEGTVSPSNITFTPENWNIDQTVTVTGTNDSLYDGNIIFQIVLSLIDTEDHNYKDLDPDDVSVTNIDVNNTWTTKASMQEARGFHSSALVDNNIYIIGGVKYGTSFVIPATTIEMYNPLMDSWINKSSTFTGSYNDTAVVDDLIYFIGRDGGSFRRDNLDVYDPSLDSWTAKASMSYARRHLTSSVVNGKIYAIAGDSAVQPYCDTIVEMYDPLSDTWTTKAPIPTGRASANSAVVDGKIYVIGGRSEGAGCLNNSTGLATVEMYDPISDTWTTKASMPTPRDMFGCTVLDNKIYVIGGNTAADNPSFSRVTSSVEMYDPLTDTWTTKPSISEAKAGLSSSATSENIYIFGGWLGSDTAWSNVVEEYTP